MCDINSLTVTWICLPLDFEIHVEIEVAGDVDNVHPVEKQLADGHHRDQGRGELGQRIHAGVVEDQAQAGNASLLLVIDIDEDVEKAVENAHDKKWRGESIPFENTLDVVLETCTNVDESVYVHFVQLWVFIVSCWNNGDLRIDVRAQKNKLSRAVSRISPVIQAQSCLFKYTSLNETFVSITDHFPVHEGDTAPAPFRPADHHVGPPLDNQGVQDTEQSVLTKSLNHA